MLFYGVGYVKMELKEMKRINTLLRKFLDGFKIPKLDEYTKDEIISFVINLIQCKNATYEQIWKKVHKDYND